MVRMRLFDVKLFSILTSLPLELDGTAATLPACLQAPTSSAPFMFITPTVAGQQQQWQQPAGGRGAELRRQEV